MNEYKKAKKKKKSKLFDRLFCYTHNRILCVENIHGIDRSTELSKQIISLILIFTVHCTMCDGQESVRWMGVLGGRSSRPKRGTKLQCVLICFFAIYKRPDLLHIYFDQLMVMAMTTNLCMRNGQ